MSYEILPPGKYRARAIEAALGETKTQKEQVVVRFELLDEGYEDQTITWFGVFATDKMSRRVLEGLRACGWYGDDLGDLSGVTENVVDLEVEHDTWQGRTTARVKWVNRRGAGPAIKPMAPERARAFAARMRGLAASIKPGPEGRAAPCAPPPRGSPQGPGDDDFIPF